jgi:hypothetical protein
VTGVVVVNEDSEDDQDDECEQTDVDQSGEDTRGKRDAAGAL